MTIFLSVVGTVLLMVVGFTFLISVYIIKQNADMHQQQAINSVTITQIAHEQKNMNDMMNAVVNGFNDMAQNMSYVMDEAQNGNGVTILHTPMGNVAAGNINEAIDKLEAKGISLTEQDIKELNQIFGVDEETE